MPVLTRSMLHRLASQAPPQPPPVVPVSPALSEEEEEPMEDIIDVSSDEEEVAPLPPAPAPVAPNLDGGANLMFPHLLRGCLDLLGLQNHTIECITERRPHPLGGSQWNAEVQISAPNPTHGGSLRARSHRSVAAHDTRDAAIEDATRQALGVLCHFHGGALNQMSGRYLPRRPSGQARHYIASDQNEGNQQLTVLIKYVAALCTLYDRTADELHRRNQQVLGFIAQQMGVPGPQPEVPVVDPTRSPPRNRTHAGTPDGSTKILPGGN